MEADVPILLEEEQIRELHKQMTEAMSVIERLRIDNDQFRGNFDQLKSANSTLQVKLAEARKRSTDATEAKVIAPPNYSTLIF